MTSQGELLIREDLRGGGAASNLQFNEHIKKLQSEGRQIHHLGFGQSPFPPPKFAQEELRKHAHVGEYLPIKGLLQLRQAACQLHKTQDGLDHFTPDNCIVGPGSKELLFLLVNVIQGDVILLSPSWTTYRPQAALARKRVFVVATCFDEGWKLTADKLDQAFAENDIKSGSVLILCNPDNPTGAAYTESELRSLSVSLTKHDVIVVSDEIYSRLSFQSTHLSIAKFCPERTMLSCGISKWASCGGWRLGYHLFPPQLKALCDAVASAASQTFTCASAPIQHAAIELLKFDDRSVSYSSHCKRILEKVAKFCCQKLRGVGVKVQMSSSGYYVFPDFEVIRNKLRSRGITTGEQMCQKILDETSVALMAGGPAYLHPPEALTVRLCYVDFNGAEALEASEKLGPGADLPDDFLHQYCSPTVDAITRVAAWVEQQTSV